MKIPHVNLEYGKRLNPGRDWSVLLVVGLLLFVSSVVWNVYLFDRVAGGEALGASPTETKAGVDQKELDALAKIFTDRTAEAAKYKDGTYYFVDPSK